MDWGNFLQSNSGGIGNLLGQGLGMLFGGKNPADKAMGDINQIPGMMRQYYEPYMKAGQAALPTMQSQYSGLVNDPGSKMNQIGQSFQQSPGFQFALKQALDAAGHAAAAGGMAGSPQHEMQNMELATQLGNQDYNNWLSNALGLYGRGLGGEENLYQTGYGASKDFGETVGNTQMQKALMDYIGQTQKNQQGSSLLGTIGNFVGAALPALFL